MLLEFISENVLLRAKNDKEQVEKFANLLSLLGPSFPDSVLKKISEFILTSSYFVICFGHN